MIQIEHTDEKPPVTAHKVLHFNGEPLIRFEKDGRIIWLMEEEVLQLRQRRDELLRANSTYQQQARDAREAQQLAELKLEGLTDYLMKKNAVIDKLRNQLFDTERLLHAYEANATKQTWWQWIKTPFVYAFGMDRG